MIQHVLEFFSLRDGFVTENHSFLGLEFGLKLLKSNSFRISMKSCRKNRTAQSKYIKQIV